MKNPTNYQKLAQRFERLSHLGHLGSVAFWDEAVNMPVGGGEARAKAMAELASIQHEFLVDPTVTEWFQAAESEVSTLSDWQRANFREMKRRWKLTHCVDPELVRQRTIANMDCEQAWRVLRPQNNWSELRPKLTRVIELAKEEAQQRSRATGLDPYDALLDLYEPGLKQSVVGPVFTELKNYLPEKIHVIRERQKAEPFVDGTDGHYAIDKQKELGLALMRAVGFDFDRGRLDVSHHPFCGGVPRDVRITTRYNEKDFTQSMMAVLHETGHACYEQNLPAEWLDQPVGNALGMSLHEGQSLFFEMQVARSREFLHFCAPIVSEYLGSGNADPRLWQPENLFRLYTRVEPGFIRVDADEVTYPLHVILRYEIEQGLLSGEVQVADIPELWNKKMQQYLGLSTLGNDRNGCMQDMHWPGGTLGYFPSYTMGALIAAQLFAAARQAIGDLPEQIRRGDFAAMRTWLSQHVWNFGSYKSLNELLAQATGAPLSTQAFKQHVERRYLS